MNDIKPDDERPTGTPPEDGQDLLEDAKTEISAMAKDGTGHPSTKPILIGAAIGFAVGMIVLDGAWFLGLIAGAAVALYLRIKK
ncbi:hypothetical protein [Erythrobacter sp. JK5]|uniref:hypothetical protein n=1 Tax=Erythrobacter sp. JK5 TaxID=2829500 RepID=UPI001BA7D4BE|nr:hypothetical protein [Erythrobacter sp. JK5]QUL38805.1 hypothetical protein KDC96_05395 [Erythrobacter sp. JK5]